MYNYFGPEYQPGYQQQPDYSRHYDLPASNPYLSNSGGQPPQPTAPQAPQQPQQPQQPQAPTPTFQGQNPTWYQGFDQNKTYSADSAKGTYFKLAQQSGVNPATLDKAGAEQWFKQHIMPGLTSAGFKVDQVSGDKAFIRTTEFPQGQWVDFVKASGSTNPAEKAYQWGAENPNQPAQPTQAPAATALPGGGAIPQVGGSGTYSGRGATAGAAQPTSAVPSGIATAEQNLIQNLLNNPYSLSPEVIAQIKGRFQDQNALGQDQLEQQIMQNAASRGMVGSGATDASLRRAQSDAYSALLGNNREVDIAAATQRTQDILNALGASNQYIGREQDLALAYSDQNLRRMLGLEGFAVDREGMALQRALADANRSEQARQFNLGLGFDYTQLGANQNNLLWQALYG